MYSYIEIKTKQGILRGKHDENLSKFHGIPYAKAKRFQYPEPADSWDGIRIATEPGAICPQLPSRLEMVMGSPGERIMSEDCHNLSIYTPNINGRKPVMVWIHGGAYVSGGGEEPWYDASRLANEGNIVTVTITYRLGIFGYLTLPEKGVINLGLEDQIAALHWIKNNIEQFGGNSDDITVFGQSAGGQSIVSILSVLKQPLFRRAIIQSAPLGLVLNPNEANNITNEFLKVLDKDPLSASTSELLNAQRIILKNSKRGITFGPVGIDIYKSSITSLNSIDILIGWTKDDGSPFVAMRKNKSGPDFGTYFDKLLTAIVTKYVFVKPSSKYAKYLKKQGANVLFYEIGWRPEGSIFRATHCLELSLLFGFNETWINSPMIGNTSNQELEKRGFEIRKVWIEFAKKGKLLDVPNWLYHF